jgi:hypothetical protein
MQLILNLVRFKSAVKWGRQGCESEFFEGRISSKYQLQFFLCLQENTQVSLTHVSLLMLIQKAGIKTNPIKITAGWY